MQVWILKTCDTCRKALAWLDEAGIAYEAKDVRDDGLDRDTIQRIVAAVGHERALNKRSTTWRGLPDDQSPISTPGRVSKMTRPSESRKSIPF